VAPVASRCAGFDRWDFAIVIPVIWQKESKRRKLERFCQVRNHDAFHERQVLRAFGSGEHLAERDWVIGSELRSFGQKVSYPHGAGKRQVITGGSRGQDTKPQPGGRTTGSQEFRPNKRIWFFSSSASTVPSCRGFVHLPNDGPPDSYRTVTFCRAMCNGRVCRG
jgi:hypothetical protein